MTDRQRRVGATRRALGPVGAFLPVSVAEAVPIDRQRDAVRRLERAGYPAAWTNEGVGGKDALVQLAVLLAATGRMILGTGIANPWARAPQTLHGAAALLEQAYPGRLVLGLGIGYPEQAASVGREFGKPLGMLRDYVAAMSAPTPTPAPDVSYPLVLAANGPKMVALGGEIADGAMPAIQPVEFTAEARRTLGPDKLLIVLVDALIGPDGEAPVAARVREHLAAGADHVMLGMRLRGDFDDGVDQLERLAPMVLGSS